MREFKFKRATSRPTILTSGFERHGGERRVLSFSSQLRAMTRSSGQKSLAGYAARYGVLSHRLPDGVGGHFRERITKGAFNRVLRTKPDTVALLNHDEHKPLGRTSSGTLDLSADDNGLAFTLDLPDTTYARDLYENVKHGDMKCSFAFSLDHDDQDWGDEEDPETRSTIPVRTIRDFAALYDISVVSSPAYPGTSVGARSLDVVDVRSLALARRNWAASRNMPGESIQALLDKQRQIARRKNLMNAIL